MMNGGRWREKSVLSKSNKWECDVIWLSTESQITELIIVFSLFSSYTERSLSENIYHCLETFGNQFNYISFK